jgi:hypothetical protein
MAGRSWLRSTYVNELTVSCTTTGYSDQSFRFAVRGVYGGYTPYAYLLAFYSRVYSTPDNWTTENAYAYVRIPTNALPAYAYRFIQQYVTVCNVLNMEKPTAWTAEAILVAYWTSLDYTSKHFLRFCPYQSSSFHTEADWKIVSHRRLPSSLHHCGAAM